MRAASALITAMLVSSGALIVGQSGGFVFERDFPTCEGNWRTGGRSSPGRVSLRG